MNNTIPWISHYRNQWMKCLIFDSIVILGKNGLRSFKDEMFENSVVIVVTKDATIRARYVNFGNYFFFDDPDQAYDFAKKLKKKIYICGGKSIFEHFYQKYRKEITKFHLTSIKRNFPFDVAFNLPFMLYESESTFLKDDTEIKTFEV